MVTSTLGMMEKGTLRTHSNSAYFICSKDHGHKQKELEKIALSSYKDGINNASLTYKKKHLTSK